MLDEKGRLFGRINIVDLLIIVVIIAAVAFVGIKYVMPATETTEEGQPVEIKIYVASSRRFVVDALEKGKPVWDSSSDTELGTLVSWEVSPYYEYSSDNGQVITYELPDICIVEVTIDGTGVVGDYGVTIGDQLYGLGHTLVFYCGESKLYGAISGLEAR